MATQKYQLVTKFWTLFKILSDGRVLAAIPMPSVAEYKYSASKVRVTTRGTLIRPKNCSFIKPPTYDELRSDRVNEMMNHNYNLIKNLMWSENENAIWDELSRWLYWCTENHGAMVIRLFYGGDFYFLSKKFEKKTPLEALNDIVKRSNYKPLQVIVRTANIAKADKDYYDMISENKLDSRIKVVAETQSYDDMPLYIKDRVRYHWEHEGVEGTVEDVASLPADSPSDSGFFKKEVQIVIPNDAYTLFMT